jgi:hypothetical protein
MLTESELAFLCLPFPNQVFKVRSQYLRVCRRTDRELPPADVRDFVVADAQHLGNVDVSAICGRWLQRSDRVEAEQKYSTSDFIFHFQFIFKYHLYLMENSVPTAQQTRVISAAGMRTDHIAFNRTSHNLVFTLIWLILNLKSNL